jgi:hypothetical protein
MDEQKPRLQMTEPPALSEAAPMTSLSFPPQRSLVPSTSVLAATAILAVLIQVYAGATLRGTYADGAHYAITMLVHQGPAILEPARWTSSMIVQWPIVAAMRLGVQTPHGIALVFSLFANMLPGLFILLCLPALPAGERHFFIFPAFAYFAGTLSAQFASVAEGLVATSYFWLLMCLITFGSFTILRSALVVVLAVGSLRLQEAMLFLGPVLVVSCVMRWQYESRLLPCTILLFAAVCALVSAVIGGRYVLSPISVDDRDSFVTNFLTFRWIYWPGSGYNLPCVLGILAVPFILVATLRAAWGTAMVGIYGALSIPLALAAFWFEWLMVPVTQFVARYNVALMSLPLAALLIVARAYKPLGTAIARRSTSGIVVLLGLAASLWHVAATEKWSSFLTHFSNVLQSRSGVIDWNTVAEPSGSAQALLAQKMVWAWTNPDLSLVALPRSCINSIIDNPPWVGWQPYNLSDLATVPAIQGITYTYLLPPEQQRAACPEECYNRDGHLSCRRRSGPYSMLYDFFLEHTAEISAKIELALGIAQ